MTDAYASELPELVARSTAAHFPCPEILILNETLAVECGLDPHQLMTHGTDFLTGGQIPQGAQPVAQAYAGHQFGAFVPQLGDGRALLLGELTTADSHVVDLHLKGSGPTPFARGGDGYASVGPMLREYLISEALHALGVPTSRSLAVTATGMPIRRETSLPGAVLTRVASSHIRVGTFQYARRVTETGGDTVLRRLADFAMRRHFPQLQVGDYAEFYRHVIDAQARLIAQWMGIGFVHGVMNTDNTTISGETIDYGPCAFLDAYRPGQVFSSIDHRGRYSYDNQPVMAEWNLARFGEAILPLLAETQTEAVDVAQELLGTYRQAYSLHLNDLLTRKLGLTHVNPEEANTLSAELLDLIDGRDWTNTFSALTDAARASSTVVDTRSDTWSELTPWVQRWLTYAPDSEHMALVNPLYIPRNHLVERALSRAAAGDLGEFEDLLAVVTAPYTERPGLGRYTEPDPHGEFFQTFCGT